jgi:hypothetical protein
MSTFSCEFCGGCFTSKYSLEKHKKTAKFCLNLQPNKDTVDEFKCEICSKIFTRRDTYRTHITSSSCKVLINQNDKLVEAQIEIERLKVLLSQYEIKIEERNDRIVILEKEVKNLLERQLENKDKLLESSNKTLESIATKAIENAGNKTTTINKNKVYQSLQCLTEDYMRQQTKFINMSTIKNGAQSIAQFASDYTFKDRLVCSDVSRLNFTFKDETGNIIKDPEGIEITKKFIEINKDELLRLLDEYHSILVNEIDNDMDAIEYKHWSERREHIHDIRLAIKKGSIPENIESYNTFKKSFLTALSELVPR